MRLFSNICYSTGRGLPDSNMNHPKEKMLQEKKLLGTRTHTHQQFIARKLGTIYHLEYLGKENPNTVNYLSNMMDSFFLLASKNHS